MRKQVINARVTKMEVGPDGFVSKLEIEADFIGIRGNRSESVELSERVSGGRRTRTFERGRCSGDREIVVPSRVEFSYSRKRGAR